MKLFKLTAFLLVVFSLSILTFAQSDAALSRVTAQDAGERGANGKILVLPVGEHLFRGDVYMKNRHFPEAREHYEAILNNYIEDQNAMPRALFGIARSYMWERQYEKAVFWFDRLSRDFSGTKDGREGLAYKGASYVRAGKNAEAAEVYKLYATMYPTGEKIEAAYLNTIDALRESGDYKGADEWVIKTRTRFIDTPTETDALHAKLRMEIFRQNWDVAVYTADILLKNRNFSGSMTTDDEVLYLKALAYDRANKRQQAINTYASIPDTPTNYYGGLATDRLAQLGQTAMAAQRASSIPKSYTRTYPVKYRSELMRYAKIRKVDPRFLLAIMKQESSFRSNAKSPAAARGLLQLVFDTALKYNKQAGFPNLQPDDLYDPNTNIAIGSLYVKELKDQFSGVYEPIAASYNGGEDNAARWLDRSKPKEAGIFASEVGFKETKNYVFKVMNNYRVYRELYTEDLLPK